jgi:hypothetical protein
MTTKRTLSEIKDMQRQWRDETNNDAVTRQLCEIELPRLINWIENAKYFLELHMQHKATGQLAVHHIEVLEYFPRQLLEEL